MHRWSGGLGSSFPDTTRCNSCICSAPCSDTAPIAVGPLVRGVLDVGAESSGLCERMHLLHHHLKA